MNGDSHVGWEFFSHLILTVAWCISFVVFMETRKDESKITPNWLNALQGTFLMSMGATKGLVIIAERLTQSWPGLFPLAYIGLFVALFAPLWIWNPQKHTNFTWPVITLGIFYLIVFTFIFALKVKYSPDSWKSSQLWIIPVGIVAAFLLFAWIFKKEQRRNVILAIFFIAGTIAWIAATSWVATWIS